MRPGPDASGKRLERAASSFSASRRFRLFLEALPSSGIGGIAVNACVVVVVTVPSPPRGSAAGVGVGDGVGEA